MDLAEIAQSTSEAIAVAMATDLWGAVRERCARLFTGETEPSGTINMLDQYDQALSASPEAGREHVRGVVSSSVLRPAIEVAIQNNPEKILVALEIRDFVANARREESVQTSARFENVKSGRDFNFAGRDLNIRNGN